MRNNTLGSWELITIWSSYEVFFAFTYNTIEWHYKGRYRSDKNHWTQKSQQISERGSDPRSSTRGFNCNFRLAYTLQMKFQRLFVIIYVE